MRLAFCTVNHSMPLRSKIRVCGSFASGSGILYSATEPVFGSSLPINAPVFPVYQMLPFASSTRPSGPERTVFNGYSLIRSEEHTSELHSLTNLVCRLLLETKKSCQ